MPEDSDNMDGFEKEIERIFNETNDLDQAGIEFEALLKTHAGKEIERIFNEGPEDRQAKIVDLVRTYAKKSLSKVTDEGAREQAIEAKVAGIEKRLEEYEAKESQLDSITPESKKNFEKLLQNFVIYEIYQEMNPRRIAGETEQMNYAANFERGGEAKAEKYVNKRKVGEEERRQIREKVQAGGASQDRTVDALDLASSLRRGLESSVNKSGLDEIRALAREAMDKKKAQEARENRGPGKDKGQGMGGR